MILSPLHCCFFSGIRSLPHWLSCLVFLCVYSMCDVSVLFGAPENTSAVSPDTSLFNDGVKSNDPFLSSDSILSAPTPPISNISAEALVQAAKRFIGIPYRWGGNSPKSGFDCSGFVQFVVSDTFKMRLPRSSFFMIHYGSPVALDALKPGDLVFFNTRRQAYSHVGIYVGDSKFIHSPHRGTVVRIDSMLDQYYTKRFDGGRRLSSLERT